MQRKSSELCSQSKMRRVLLIDLCFALRDLALAPIRLTRVLAACFVAPAIVLLAGCAAPSALTKVAKTNAAIASQVEAARVIARTESRQTALLRLYGENQSPSAVSGLSDSEWDTFKALACPSPINEEKDSFTAVLLQETARIDGLSTDLNALDLGFAGWLKNGNDALAARGSPTSTDFPQKDTKLSDAALEAAKRCTAFLYKLRQNPSSFLSTETTAFISVQAVPDPAEVATARAKIDLGTSSANEGTRSLPLPIADLEQTIILRAIASDAATPVASKPSPSLRLQFPARMSVIESALGALDLLALNWANQARVGTLKWLILDVESKRKFEDAALKFAGPSSRVAAVIAQQRLMAIGEVVTAFAATIPENPASNFFSSSPRATRVAALERLRAIHDLRNALGTWDIAISVDSDDIVTKLKKSREAIGKFVETSPQGFEAVLDQVEQVFKRMRAIERPITTGLTTIGK